MDKVSLFRIRLLYILEPYPVQKVSEKKMFGGLQNERNYGMCML